MTESGLVINASRLRLSLAGIVISLGFASIALYMGSTILYPLLQINEFAGKALHNGLLNALMGRYIGYIPLLIFGIISVAAGNWFWYTKKEISNTVIAAMSMLLIMVFVVLILKIIVV